MSVRGFPASVVANGIVISLYICSNRQLVCSLHVDNKPISFGKCPENSVVDS